MADYDYDSARMKDASYAEASWDRFLLQQVCGLGGFFTVLILTRLWTSFSHTRFQASGAQHRKAFFPVWPTLCSIW